jgi:glycine/D-amino acid oxidase-like deaminating enzyme
MCSASLSRTGAAAVELIDSPERGTATFASPTIIEEMMRVLICGGGVIGASLAYFLSRRGAHAVVIERAGVACGASGKSGGFLALDWCDGTPLEHLARRSFALHQSLSEELGGDWGYRRLDTYAGSLGGRATSSRRKPEWLGPEVSLTKKLGSAGTTAQVQPCQFTAAMMRAAEAQGAELRSGQITGLSRDGARVRGVDVEGDVIEGDAVIIAMGPWSTLATRWLSIPAVYGLKGHSIVFETGSDVPPEALFLEYPDRAGQMLTPEVFPRADGTTYVCAISSDTPLPVDPTQVVPDPGAMERLEALCSRLAPALTPSRIMARQACYRPVTQDGLPLIGEIPGAPGAYVATGHSVWGILNAPATAEALSELIYDGRTGGVDLDPFSPVRRSLWPGLPNMLQ